MIARVLAVVFLALGCSSNPKVEQSSPGPSSDETGQRGGFQFVRLESGGSNCEPCWRTFEITSSHELILTDASSKDTFALDETEAAAFDDVVQSSAFSESLLDPEDCAPIPDDANVLIASWENIGPVADTHPSRCFGSRGDSHVYSQLYWMLIDLKNKYLGCEVRESSPSWNPSSGPPPIRMMCWPCNGSC